MAIVTIPQSREDIEMEQAYDAMLIKQKQEHELAMAKLKFSTMPKTTAWQKVVVTLFKAPTFPIVIIAITALTMGGKPVPQSLEHFLLK